MDATEDEEKMGLSGDALKDRGNLSQIRDGKWRQKVERMSTLLWSGDRPEKRM